jgi:hypothetical protein
MEGFQGEFDWSNHSRSYLCEAALRLLAALYDEPRFPDDEAGIVSLLSRVAQGRPGEAIEFAMEPTEGLPRYAGRDLIWIQPAPEGSLRLRHEWGDLRSMAVVLSPAGRLGEFQSIVGFGVAESELTEQARADLKGVGRLAQERRQEETEVHQKIDEDQRRFQTEHLRAVRAAPPQKAGGPVVSFVALYDTGIIVYYLVPRPADVDSECEDPWAEPLVEAMDPWIELIDGLGTSFEEVDWNHMDPNAPLTRASRSFIPAVPAEATRIHVQFASGGVEIDLGPR